QAAGDRGWMEGAEIGGGGEDRAHDLGRLDLVRADQLGDQLADRLGHRLRPVLVHRRRAANRAQAYGASGLYCVGRHHRSIPIGRTMTKQVALRGSFWMSQRSSCSPCRAAARALAMTASRCAGTSWMS